MGLERGGGGYTAIRHPPSPAARVFCYYFQHDVTSYMAIAVQLPAFCCNMISPSSRMGFSRTPKLLCFSSQSDFYLRHFLFCSRAKYFCKCFRSIRGRRNCTRNEMDGG
ncbi:unnamed protein product, partial [Pylaiella littoralis]